jgi:hypothetical protein
VGEEDKYTLKEVFTITIQKYDEQLKDLKVSIVELEKALDSKFSRFWAVLYTTLGALILNLVMLLIQKFKA